LINSRDFALREESGSYNCKRSQAENATDGTHQRFGLAEKLP
jgi:hypothetical protein